MHMFAFSSMQVTCITLLYLILSVLSASYQLRFLGTFLKFISIYTFCLVEYISYLKIFLKEECIVMKTLIIWKTFYKGNEKQIGPRSVFLEQWMYGSVQRNSEYVTTHVNFQRNDRQSRQGLEI